jgi:hypothetical protein
MRTLIANGHVVDVVAHRIGDVEAQAVCNVLRSVEHIALTADLSFDGRVVHLRPQRDLLTPERVTTMRAFAAVTDAELRWHQAVAA